MLTPFPQPKRALEVPLLRPRPAELSVVIPTFKERGNVAELVRRLDETLRGIAWEAVFVDDDSPDGTSDAVKALGGEDIRVRCIRRVGRRGLSGATIEGMLASSAEFVAVMDADLQHDETALPQMLRMLRTRLCDMVVGTRYADGGDASSFSAGRHKASRLATELAQKLLGVTLSDPMSGFFMVRRDKVEALAPRLSTQGFKILLDLAVTGRHELRVAEVPYTFGERLSGESKLDTRIALDFLGLLAAKLTGDWISPRFFFFAAVGALGMVVHLLTLDIGFKLLGLNFGLAQVIATIVAMTGNFFLNNRLTYRDQRLTGWPLLRGLLGFYAICSFGAVVNYGVAVAVFAHQPVWWLAGGLGAIGGAIWNFAMANSLVWRVK